MRAHRVVWMGLLLAVAACGSSEDGTPNGPCGPNGACPKSYTCEPKSNTCLLSSGSPDAGGGTQDSRGFDAPVGGFDARLSDGGADARPATDAPRPADAGGLADGPGGTAPVTTLVPDFSTTAPVNRTMVRFTFTASIAGATFRCTVDGVAKDCSSPLDLTLAENAHTVSVAATAGGVAEVSPPSVTFKIDLTAPVTTIGAPADKGTVGANANLIYSAGELTSKFECSFDGKAFAACGSGLMGSTPISLPNGPHTAAVKATDLAGNPGVAALVSFTVDTTALTVTVGPRATQCAGETIPFGASRTATFTCALDGATATACTTPYSLPVTIAGGAHTLAVTALDTLAQTQTQTLPFTIDLTAPAVFIDGVTPTSDAFGRYQPSGSIAYSSTEPAPATTYNGGHGFLCTLGTGAPGDCTQGGGSSGSYLYSGLSSADNPVTFTVTAFDACGNMSSASLDLNVVETPSTPCFTAVRTTGGPSVTNKGNCLRQLDRSGNVGTTGANGTLTFAARPGLYTCEIFTNVVMKVPGTLPIPFACAPDVAIPFTNLADFGLNGAPFTLEVSRAGVVLADLRWTVDATPPDFFVSSQYLAPVNTGDLTFSYSYTPPGDVLGKVTCLMDGLPCAVCTGSQAVCKQQSAGRHSFTVQGRDIYMNLGGLGSPDANIVATYGPSSGRAILFGSDFETADTSAAAILAAALNDVPWKHGDVRPFNRSVRVTTYNAGQVSPAELVNVGAVLTSVGATVHEFSDPNDFFFEVAGSDVLLVYDQNNSTKSLIAGQTWEDPEAPGPLRRFLNAGGVAIVLDGHVGSNQNVFSDNWQIFDAGGFNPIIDVNQEGQAAVAAPTGGTLYYIPGPADVVFGDTSELKVVDQYPAFTNSVVFGINDESRTDYGQPAGCAFCNPSVLEGVFPSYFVDWNIFNAKQPPPHQPFFAIPVLYLDGPTLDPADYSAVDCAVQVSSCLNADPAQCCAGGGSTCACQENVVNGTVVGYYMPNGAGQYELEVRVVDPNGRPGVGVRGKVTTSLLPATLRVSNGLYCLRANETTGVSYTVSRTLNGIYVADDATVATACSGMGYQASYTDPSPPGCTAGVHVDLYVHATDAYGNAASAQPNLFTCP